MTSRSPSRGTLHTASFGKPSTVISPMTEESSIKVTLEELAMGETGHGSANVSATRNPKTESETQVLESQVAPPDPLRSTTPMPEGDDVERTYTVVEQA